MLNSHSVGLTKNRLVECGFNHKKKKKRKEKQTHQTADAEGGFKRKCDGRCEWKRRREPGGIHFEVFEVLYVMICLLLLSDPEKHASGK